MSYLNHNLPAFNCYIRDEYLYNHESGHGGHTPCHVHTVASIENRTPLFEAFLENGVNWTRRPLTAFCWKINAPVLPLDEQLYWDCFSPYIDVQVRARLIGLQADLLSASNARRIGRYMFTLDWSWENKAVLDTNFSEMPEHKCAHVFAGEDGNYFAYPNNRVVWFDYSWTRNRITKNPGYKIDTTIYSVENKRKTETSDHFTYDDMKTTEPHDPNAR